MEFFYFLLCASAFMMSGDAFGHSIRNKSDGMLGFAIVDFFLGIMFFVAYSDLIKEVL